MSHSDSPSIVYETTIDALVTEAWALLSDFGGWAKWCPMFKNMRIINGKTGVDSIRKYTTITESSYEEILRELDNEKHTFHYDFIALHPSQPGLNGITHRVAMVPVVNKETQEATLTKITWSAWIETAGIPDQLRLGILSKQRMAYEKISETLHVRILAEKIMKIGMEFFNDKVMAMTRALLIKQGDLWEYDQYDDSLGFLPRMIKGLPTSEALPPQRMADMLARFLEIAYLQVGELVAATNNPQPQPQQETDEIDYAKGNLAIIDYGKIQAPGLKTVLNHMLENWTDDVEFCQQLLQGANPLHIKMVKDFAEVPDCLNGLSVTDPSGKKKSVKDLVHEKRLFILDYREFVKFDIIPPAYFSAPVMLVYREIIDEYTSRLNVLGIQLHPHHKEIYTPDMPQKNRYKLAKMFVANADCQLHEFRYHLGIAHMGMEPIAVAVHNRFKDTHPVRVLLTPHLEGTIGITFLARQTLIAEKEAFTDKTFAIGTKQGIRLVSDGWRSYDFFKSSFPEQLEARGFDEAGTDGVKDYLYRDDGFKLWNAIGAYTTDFVNKFYPTDADVAKDGDIQRWADEMSSKDAAYIPGFPNLIETKESLAHILQIIIWNGSAQHSVVNNPQYPYASFVPNRPNIIFRPMPELPEDGSDIDADYLKAAMSPQIMVMFQLTLSWILSLPSDSNLTDLRALKNIYPEGDAKFQAILSKVATDIKARNQALEAAGKAPYIFLLPENVACSVNI